MLLVQIITISASLILLVHAMSKILKMTRKTCHYIRASYIFIAVATFGEIAAIIFVNHKPNISELLIVVGFALLQSSCRRQRSSMSVKGTRHA